jgi:hypothetical protein
MASKPWLGVAALGLALALFGFVAAANAAQKPDLAGAKGAAGSIPPPGYFPRPSHPLTVTPAPQLSHAVSKRISSTAGGTLTATGGDGTKYTLQIPPGALSSDEKITMIPVSSIAGSPLGSLIGAVEITPHGLLLLKRATLTIVPHSPVALRRQAGFGAAGGGGDFGLYPLDRGVGIVMSLNHFSTYGVANATDAQAQTAVSHMPVRTEAQLQQLAGEILRQARESGKPIDLKALAGLYVAYYRDIVKPLTDKALTDDTYAVSASTSLLAWARQIENLSPAEGGGLKDDPGISPLFDGYRALLAKIDENAIRQRYERCVQSDDLSEIVRLLAAERQAQILGLNVGTASSLAQKCAHFELDVTTTSHEVRFTGDANIIADIGVEDDVPIAMDATLRATGQHDPEYTDWRVRDGYCSVCASADGTAVDATSRVDGLGLDYNVIERMQPDGKIVRDVPRPKLALGFDPGLTRELFTYTGAGQTNATVWNDTWTGGHHDELVPGQARLFDLTNWQTLPPGSGRLIATKSYPPRGFCQPYFPGCDPGDNTETTTLKLYHRPQG